MGDASRTCRHVLGCLALASTCLASAVTLAQEPVPFKSSSEAPAAWQRYTALLKNRLEQEIAGDSAAAKHFRDWASQAKATGNAPPESLIARIWIDPGGKVLRATFPALPDPAADADLKAILLGSAIEQPPPRDMLQPISLRLAFRRDG